MAPSHALPPPHEAFFRRLSHARATKCLDTVEFNTLTNNQYITSGYRRQVQTWRKIGGGMENKTGPSIWPEPGRVKLYTTMTYCEGAAAELSDLVFFDLCVFAFFVFAGLADESVDDALES